LPHGHEVVGHHDLRQWARPRRAHRTPAGHQGRAGPNGRAQGLHPVVVLAGLTDMEEMPPATGLDY
jgi:hypothetical protein